MMAGSPGSSDRPGVTGFCSWADRELIRLALSHTKMLIALLDNNVLKQNSAACVVVLMLFSVGEKCPF